MVGDLPGCGRITLGSDKAFDVAERAVMGIMGWSDSFVGTLFIALATSTPEPCSSTGWWHRIPDSRSAA